MYDFCRPIYIDYDIDCLVIKIDVSITAKHDNDDKKVDAISSND